MAKTIHPKTGGAAIGAAAGILLVAIANTIHSVHVPYTVADAIGAFLPVVGAYLTPSPDTPAARPRRADVSAGAPNRAVDPGAFVGMPRTEVGAAPPSPLVVAHGDMIRADRRAELLTRARELIAELEHLDA